MEIRKLERRDDQKHYNTSVPRYPQVCHSRPLNQVHTRFVIHAYFPQLARLSKELVLFKGKKTFAKTVGRIIRGFVNQRIKHKQITMETCKPKAGLTLISELQIPYLIRAHGCTKRSSQFRDSTSHHFDSVAHQRRSQRRFDNIFYLRNSLEKQLTTRFTISPLNSHIWT